MASITYLKQFFLLNGTVCIKAGLEANLHDFFITHQKTDIFLENLNIYKFLTLVLQEIQTSYLHARNTYTHIHTHLHKCMCESVFVSA